MVRFLFWLQIAMAWVYTGPQVLRLIEGRAEGLNLAIYAIFMSYLAFSLSLAVQSYREKRERIRRDTVIVFSQWVVFIGLILVLGVRVLVWTTGDTIVTATVFVLFIVTILKFGSITDPVAKGFLAMWCKAVPQLWLASTIAIAGGADGLPLWTLVAGHLTSIPRLIQVYVQGRKGGWDRPTRGLMLGETSNVVTWTIVTVVWMIF